MTELQAEQGAPALDVPRTGAKPRRNRDALIALAVFVGACAVADGLQQ